MGRQGEDDIDHRPLHLVLAWGEFEAAGLLTKAQLDLVDWQIIHSTLSGVPWMLQVLACKQV